MGAGSVQCLVVYSPLFSMSALHVTSSQEFTEKVLKSPIPVLVDFYADWCGPCKFMAPILDQIAQEQTGASVMKVDVDALGEIAGTYNVSSIPTFLVFSGGKVVGQAIGAIGKAQLVKLISDARANATQ